MYQLTLIGWILIGFGMITFIPLLMAQLTILIDPKGQRAKDILIGKGEEWRNETHFKFSYGAAIADWLIFFPIFILAIIGMIVLKPWGYLLLSIAGTIQIYINTILWFTEKKYVYPNLGPWKYYTYFWGNFMYWGVGALIYGILKIAGMITF